MTLLSKRRGQLKQAVQVRPRGCSCCRCCACRCCCRCCRGRACCRCWCCCQSGPALPQPIISWARVFDPAAPPSAPLAPLPLSPPTPQAMVRQVMGYLAAAPSKEAREEAIRSLLTITEGKVGCPRP